LKNGGVKLPQTAQADMAKFVEGKRKRGPVIKKKMQIAISVYVDFYNLSRFSF
jgi:hypothetical protein